MALLSPVLRSLQGHKLAFKCPGCGQNHQLYIGQKNAENPEAWVWNGDPHRPTFSPSVNAHGIRLDLTDEEEDAYDDEFARLTRELGDVSKAGKAILKDMRWASVCHSYVEDGQIRFLGDCTHEHKNKTLPLGKWSNHEEETA